ncbi:galactosylceramidase [Streptacidiphilus sp. PB12-B1b]|uniref:galactosylceramidase n=1 Tax=Streptacidiphilus sp. PB12-B1b TaxID=2705012 RepID=UPI0015FD21A6|nr:galactosylceramidase [Streptacidiphilus sp. PB12-B1b]QMU76018.1 galactosylceramidase [Streptacidiphilus sp. PB12-B1b]
MQRPAVPWPATAAAVIAVATLLLGVSMAYDASPRPVVTRVTVDGDSPGRTFDGIGAISGGGGNSRLLADYPAAQRAQIMDYLFKPGYGAALQILKVEIGGDTNSTDGAEPSIEHTRGTVDCDAGYEWPLMEQAKALNPAVKLYGLAWGAPGWIGHGSFWSTDTVDYLVTWLGCARQHGLTIDYLGGWNERGYNAAWYEQLHAALLAHGYGSTQIVGADSTWQVAGALRGDPAFAAAVGVIGVHYPCTYLSAMTRCTGNADADATGKQLWASENGSEDFQAGAAPIARAINRGYLDARLSAFVNWPLVASLYQNLPYRTDGLLTADQPWSGAYTVGASTWAIAQTTQFTQPGWRYVDSGSGYLGGDRDNGSYVSYRAPGKAAWSTVLETLDAKAAQTLELSVSGGLPGGALHVWSTDLTGTRAARAGHGAHLVRQADLKPTGGRYRLTLLPGRVYTVTTTTGQGAGTAAGPAPAPLALPYADSFGGVPVGGEARYLADMNGAFEGAPCAGGRPGTCVRQMDTDPPITWDRPSTPYALLGGLDWSDYTVSAETLLQQPGSVQLLGRVGQQKRFDPAQIDGYRLELTDRGAWTLVRTSSTGAPVTLDQGTLDSAAGTGSWHRLALSFSGDRITASIDGEQVGAVTDADGYRTGQVGLGTGSYLPAEFADLSVTPNQPRGSN